MNRTGWSGGSLDGSENKTADKHRMEGYREMDGMSALEIRMMVKQRKRRMEAHQRWSTEHRKRTMVSSTDGGWWSGELEDGATMPEDGVASKRATMSTSNGSRRR